MAHVRRNVNLREAVKKANHYILHAETREIRRGIAMYISSVMMDANNYHGFQYRYRVPNYTTEGKFDGYHDHGISSERYRAPDGCSVPAYDHENADDSMIAFYWPI